MHYRLLQETSLRYFLEVVRTRSIKEAAERLHVAPSAVSRQIAKLEQALETLLFDRLPRGMVPNAAGELLAAYAKRAENDIDRVASDIMMLRGLRLGRVRLAVTPGFASDLVPTAAAHFRRNHPTIHFDMTVCSHGEIAQRIREGAADIGLTLSSMPEPEIKLELRHACPIYAVMSSQHPLAQQTQLTLAQVTAYPLALPAGNSSVGQLLDTCCSRQGLRYEKSFISNQLDSLISFVAADSNSIAFYGELSIRQQLAQGRIAAIPLRDREMSERYLEIQTRANRSLSDAAKAFVAHLVEVVCG